jgi:hypothetical protein
MDIQGVHDILQCAQASHTEVANDLDLVEEDFHQDALDSLCQDDPRTSAIYEYDQTLIF